MRSSITLEYLPLAPLITATGKKLSEKASARKDLEKKHKD